MKVAIVARPGTVMNLAEDAADDFSLAGHDVKFISTRHRFFPPFINNFIYSEKFGAFRARAIVNDIEQFNPDVILAIGAYQLPPIVLASIHARRHRCPFVAWVGNKFSEDQAKLSSHFDLVAYSDTGLIITHNDYKLRTPSISLPYGARANPNLDSAQRAQRMIFIGNPNPHRRAIINSVRSQIDIYGPRWLKSPMSDNHIVTSRKMGPQEVQALYRQNSLTLNMKSDAYNIDGLNQRHFAPYPFGCAVVAEFMKDIEVCFDIDKEIFVWSNPDELNALYEKLLASRQTVERVAEAGKRRVLSEHLYRHRLATIMKAVT